MTSATKNKKIFFLSIFLIPSLLCLGFYYFAIRKPLSEGRRDIFVKLPHYGPSEFNGTDSAFYKLPSFELINQLNVKIDAATIENKIFVISVSKVNSAEANQIAAQLYRAQDKLSYLLKSVLLSKISNNSCCLPAAICQ